MNSKVLGACGETIATEYLVKNGYKILDKNFSNSIGEIDIVACKNNLIVFVEVKARTSKKFGLPCESVNYIKQQKIKKVALSYLKMKKKLQTQCRFDVIEVLNNEINHIENAF